MKVFVGDREFVYGQYYKVTTPDFVSYKPAKFLGAKIDSTSGKYWFYFQNPDGGEYAYLFADLAIADAVPPPNPEAWQKSEKRSPKIA